MTESSKYHCQRCKLLLSMDSSLPTLTKAQTHLLTSTKTAWGRGNAKQGSSDLGDEPSILDSRLSLLEKVTAENNQVTQNNQNSQFDDFDVTGSFVILPQFEEEDDGFGNNNNSQRGFENYSNGSNKALSSRLKSLSSIFDVLSSKSEIDYPICKDCAQLYINGLKSQYEKAAKERDVYVHFLQKLENKQGPFLSRAEDAIKEVDKLKDQERKLLKELQDLEKENDDFDREINELQSELDKTVLEEQYLFKKKNKEDLEYNELALKRDTIKAEYEFNLRQLEKLRKTNVYNDAFNISHDGPFGTINGLRLGRLDSTKVPWQEINAALGQVVLLLATVCSRLNITLVGYKLKPMGSTSRIEKIDPNHINPENPKVTELEVFSSGEYQIERLFTHQKLDNSMVALLDILTQIEKKLKEFDENIELPYGMVKDKIGEASIILSSKVSDSEWTGACKFLLTNAKWILAYSSAHSPSNR